MYYVKMISGIAMSDVRSIDQRSGSITSRFPSQLTLPINDVIAA